MPMKNIICAALALSCSLAPGAPRQLSLSHLTGPIYIAEDSYYSKENSVVYVGAGSVTVVGATWIPETAKLLAGEVGKITGKPITEVIDTIPGDPAAPVTKLAC